MKNNASCLKHQSCSGTKMTVQCNDLKPQECQRVEQKDYISELPLCLLLHILSLLTLKDAAVTSTLSKYWSQLWLSAHKVLDFDASQVIPAQVLQLIKELDVTAEDVIALMPKYAGWVSKVLASHRVKAIDKFRVSFVLDESNAEDITEWLNYAFARRVQRLELDLSSEFCPFVDIDLPYVFPQRLLECPEEFPDISSDNLNFLKSLRLSGVYLTDEVVRSILNKCRFLECLKLHDCDGLSRVEVCGPSLALRHLEITTCWNIKCIIVRDADCLVSLKVTNADILVENVPKLVEAFLIISCREFKEMIASISSHLSKLEALTIQLHNVKEAIEVPELSELKQLSLIVTGDDDDTIMLLTQLIRSSPKLEKFVLQYEWGEVMYMSREKRELMKCPRFPLQHLKLVELVGYFGRVQEDELLLYLIENSVALEKVTINPHDPNPEEPFDQDTFVREEEKAKECAQKLVRFIPASVEFVIV